MSYSDGNVTWARRTINSSYSVSVWFSYFGMRWICQKISPPTVFDNSRSSTWIGPVLRETMYAPHHCAPPRTLIGKGPCGRCARLHARTSRLVTQGCSAVGKYRRAVIPRTDLPVDTRHPDISRGSRGCVLWYHGLVSQRSTRFARRIAQSSQVSHLIGG